MMHTCVHMRVSTRALQSKIDASIEGAVARVNGTTYLSLFMTCRYLFLRCSYVYGTQIIAHLLSQTDLIEVQVERAIV